MNTWGWIVWCALLVAGPASLYGLHRLALRLEERGWIYYVRRKPSGGSGFSPLHEAIEPQSRHVYHIAEERRPVDEDDAPGDGLRPPRGPEIP